MGTMVTRRAILWFDNFDWSSDFFCKADPPNGRKFTRSVVTLYRGRLFSNAVAKIMVIFSSHQEVAFSDVLRILICQYVTPVLCHLPTM